MTAEDDDTSVPVLPSRFFSLMFLIPVDRPMSRTKAPKEAGTTGPGMFCAVAVTAFKGTHGGFQ